MINEITNDANARMKKSIETLKDELTKLRTGRAHPSLLDHIMVSYYGTDTALNQVANITVENARTLMVTPWEKNLIPVIEKAIMTSGLGLNPATAGTVIRIPLPALTEERRRDLTRVVRDEGEKARVAIRNIRRDANTHCKDLVKEKEISEDEERRGQAEIQKITDKFIAEIDEILGAKEKDLMEV